MANQQRLTTWEPPAGLKNLGFFSRQANLDTTERSLATDDSTRQMFRLLRFPSQRRRSTGTD